MIELIQGEGGVVPVPREFVKRVDEICKEKDLVFVIDEVQTGIGRTGTLLCYEQYDISPDVISLAKGLGGGLPVGAVLMNEKVAGVLSYGLHGSTFGGNPVSCAGAKYILDKILSPEFLKEVNEKAAYLRSELEKLPQVENVTGLGLMLGAQLKEGYVAAEIAGKCAEKGALVLTAKTKLRFLPPLTITYEEINQGLKVLKDCLNG